ncbi:RNB domain-containing ribonuclease [Leptolyngbya sp. 'hensonii']|nr:ribonuclease R family protein [Leptolyngbya sp. 'hensonii']OLP19270.1 RNB domain-containing ribonuclease [Leptolyngbya sp. 'hensonii']
MEKGTLVEFRLHGDRRLAVIERPEGKKNWIAIDVNGHAHTLHPRQVSYEVTGQAYRSAEIPNFLEQVQPLLDPSSLEVAWELLAPDNAAVEPAEMAQLLFSDQGPAPCYAAYYLLSEDKLYFKQKGDRYEPRSATQVAELKHQISVEAQRQLEWQDFITCLQQSLAGKKRNTSGASDSEILIPDSATVPSPEPWADRYRSRIEALERFAVFGEEATHRAPAMETLAALGRSETPQGAFDLLVDLGLWGVHENLFLRRSQIPTHFPTKVLPVVQRCLESSLPDSDSNQRLDLTHLKVVTIDDESTCEIDDGLSLEYLEDDRQRIWIHIADPTRWLLPGDELDLEARRRSTTIYLPTGMIPMFPTELATGPMSLIQGRTCYALSFGVTLDETGAVENYTIHTSLIKPTYRLTYEDVDEILDLGVRAEPEIDAISGWAKQRQAWRQSQGAISINMPESSIKVRDDEITIQLLEDSPSRQMVAEMMILAGEVAARYGQEHNLVLPFRNQSQPELPPPTELLQLPAGPVRSCAIRRCMPRSEVSITPSRHASLGLDTYTQVTSPIRRYNDLLAHFQLKAHLRGDSLPFSEAEMRELLLSIGTTAQEASLVERQTNRYWSLEFLRRHGGEVWQALMLRWLREHENLALIMLEDLGLELAMRFNRPIEPGDRCQVKVAYADPRQDVIQLEELLVQTAQPA